MKNSRIFIILIIIFSAVNVILLLTTGNVILSACITVAEALYVIISELKYNRISKVISNLSQTDKKEYLHENEILTEKELELNMLESQINPHFLYNTLDSIRGEALLNNQPELAKMTESLSKFFRFCISSRDHIVALSEELNNVETYYRIQKFRFGDKINLKIELNDIQPEEYFIPKIMIQPLVENAIVHGLEKVARDGEIIIRIAANEEDLHIEVEDNGGGMKYEELMRLNNSLIDNSIKLSSHDHTGIALRTVNRRLKLYFGEKYGIHYQSIFREGTRAEMVLPVIDVFSKEKYKILIK